MTDLKKLLDEAAGPEESLTDEQLAGAIARGRRSRRHRGAGLVTAAAMAVVVAGTAWTVWPSAGPGGADAPVAGAPAAAEAAGTTCAQLATKYSIVLRRADSAGKPMTPHLALSAASGKEQQYLNHTSQDRATWVFVTFTVAGSSRPAPDAVINVPAPGPHGWTDKVWRSIATTCYPVG